MQVVIDDRRALVLDAEDLGRLHVSTSESADDVAETLRASGLGRMDADGSHAWLDITVLHQAAAAKAGGPDWEARWDAMIGYAQRKGWLDQNARCLRAHVEVRARTERP